MRVTLDFILIKSPKYHLNKNKNNLKNMRKLKNMEKKPYNYK